MARAKPAGFGRPEETAEDEDEGPGEEEGKQPSTITSTSTREDPEEEV
jgi:hypothetical protein